MSYITLYNLRMVKKKFRFRRIFIFTFPFHSKRTRQKKWQSIRITHYKHVQFYTNEMIKTMSQTWRKLLHATFFQNLRKKWKNHGIVLRIGMPLVGWRGECTRDQKNYDVFSRASLADFWQALWKKCVFWLIENDVINDIIFLERIFFVLFEVELKNEE